MSKKNTISFILLAVFCLTLAYSAGYFTHALLNPARPVFPRLTEAYTILDQHSFDDLPEAPTLEYGMIRGMVQAFGDPYTIFVEPVQHELDSDSLQGSFGGIGVRIGREGDGTPVLYPFPGSPAEAAGVQSGDRLLRVDDLEIDSATGMETIQAAIRGPVGERVELAVLRPQDSQIYEFSIRREVVTLPSVTWHLAPGEKRVGILEINLLAASTPDEVTRAIEDLTSQGARHFVLDLRDNNGGLLTAGVDTARLFLKQGDVIQQQYRGKDVETFRVERPGPFSDLSMVVLVNQNTASAAEIVAGALGVQERARLLGSPTFGKDSIQLVFDLEDGSSLHVTAARWWIPGLSPPLGDGGLRPDVSLDPQSMTPDEQVEQAIRLLVGEGS